ncbi:hypothetical protein GCM10009733_007950 [Nonomuraea maheshkhaliensis]|uniref:Aminoglycoside phosphotransferase family protein n=1 Tax=Nonomuraea maheshkhaliensis TaxID=419590 RepID=A0ABN2EU08_9ACTN
MTIRLITVLRAGLTRLRRSTTRWWEWCPPEITAAGMADFWLPAQPATATSPDAPIEERHGHPVRRIPPPEDPMTQTTEEAARLSLKDLPDDRIFDAITLHSGGGELLRVEYMPVSLDGGALVARLEFSDGSRAVLKAARRGGRAGEQMQREIWARTHGISVPGPPLLWAGTVDQFHMLLTRYVNDFYRNSPSLTSGSPDLPAVLDGLAAFENRRTADSVPGGAPLFEEDLVPVVQDAYSVLDTLPDLDRDVWMSALHRVDFHAVAGTTLLHGALVPRHLLVAPGNPLVIADWAGAAYGRAWADLVPFGVHLVCAGWLPDAAEELLQRTFPCWRQAPHGAVTGLIAAWTLHQALLASHTPPTALQSAGLAWVSHRLRPV